MCSKHFARALTAHQKSARFNFQIFVRRLRGDRCSRLRRRLQYHLIVVHSLNVRTNFPK